jgi:hypothetical protein
MTRDEKILLLKGFAAGKISLEDLTPKDMGITIGLDGTTYFINDEAVAQEELWKEVDKTASEKPIFKVVIE